MRSKPCDLEMVFYAARRPFETIDFAQSLRTTTEYAGKRREISINAAYEFVFTLR